MNEDLKERLRRLNIEDITWLVFIGLIILSLYANEVERNYLIYNNEKSKAEYRKLLIFIFSVAVIIYLYYIFEEYQDFIHLTDKDSTTTKKYTTLSLIGSIFIFIGGAIFLYIAVTDEEIEAEIAL